MPLGICIQKTGEELSDSLAISSPESVLSIFLTEVSVDSDGVSISSEVSEDLLRKAGFIQKKKRKTKIIKRPPIEQRMIKSFLWFFGNFSLVFEFLSWPILNFSVGSRSRLMATFFCFSISLLYHFLKKKSSHLRQKCHHR